MTEQDKKLLLKDLCARLPYGVKCNIKGDDTNTPRKLTRIEVDEIDGILLDFGTDRENHISIQVYLSEVKPYFRPMSSMTDEEKTEFRRFITWTFDCDYQANTLKGILNGNEIETDHIVELFDWLNDNHFDYRNLIEKGLALEAKEGVY